MIEQFEHVGHQMKRRQNDLQHAFVITCEPERYNARFLTFLSGLRLLNALGLQRRFKRLARVISVPPGIDAQLVKNPALPALARLLVAGRREVKSSDVVYDVVV
ncbi:hypothetical protein [Mycobacterium avium]|uniref:hypothetical protein n=1 Tax=Mycobacterium avium TaxID=1764 RepID=UPI0015E1DD0B|nr:hypothetical protein [Mycobacterium avium]